jgi:hypothetical protein
LQQIDYNTHMSNFPYPDYYISLGTKKGKRLISDGNLEFIMRLAPIDIPPIGSRGIINDIPTVVESLGEDDHGFARIKVNLT